jgi:hypothetical protein
MCASIEHGYLISSSSGSTTGRRFVAKTQLNKEHSMLPGWDFISFTQLECRSDIFDTMPGSLCLARSPGHWAFFSRCSGPFVLAFVPHEPFVPLVITCGRFGDFGPEHVGFSAIGALVNPRSASTTLLQPFPHSFPKKWLVTGGSAHQRVDHCAEICQWWLRTYGLFFLHPLGTPEGAPRKNERAHLHERKVGRSGLNLRLKLTMGRGGSDGEDGCAA